MSVYSREGSKSLWIDLWDGRSKKRIRVSSGTDDREKARAIETTLKQAYRRELPADKLHAILDVLSGPRNAVKSATLTEAWTQY